MNRKKFVKILSTMWLCTIVCIFVFTGVGYHGEASDVEKDYYTPLVLYSINVTTDQTCYILGETVNISGYLTANGEGLEDMDIAIEVKNPNSISVFVDQPTTGLNGYYSTKFTIPATAVVGEYTVYAAFNVKGVSNTSTFNVLAEEDTIPPTSSVDAISPYWQISTSFTITATASDNSSGVANIGLYYYNSTDNSTFNGPWLFSIDTDAPWSWDFDFPNGSGYYQFYSIATDVAGNVEDYNGIDALCGCDVTPPVSNVDTLSSYWYNSNVVITATASDPLAGVKNVTLYYSSSPDNTTWSSYTLFSVDVSSPWEWTFTFPDGPAHYRFYTIAIDNIDNTENPPATADTICGFDTTPPESSIELIGPYWCTDYSSIIINCTAQEIADPIPASLLKEVALYYRYSEDNSTWEAWASYDIYLLSVPIGAINIQFSFTPTEDGYYQFCSLATDVAGNVENKTLSSAAEVGVDTTMPMLSITLSSYVNTSTFTVIWSGNDSYGSGIATYTVYYQEDNGTGYGNWVLWKDATTEISDNFTGTEGYRYRFNVTAIDIAGNINATGITAETLIDLTAPTADSIIIASGALYTNSLTVELTVTATDPLPGVNLSASGIGFVGFSNDGVNYTWYEYTGATYSWNLTSGDDGLRTVYFKVRDVAGNEALTSVNDTIILDMTAPTSKVYLNGVEVYSGYIYVWFTADVNVTITASDNLAGMYYIDYVVVDYDTGVTLGDAIVFADTVSFNISDYAGYDGIFVVYWLTVDNADNIDSDGLYYWLVGAVIDTTAPSTTPALSGTMGDNDWYVGDVTVTLSATDATSDVNYTMYKVDDGSWQLYTGPFIVSGDGQHTVYFYSVDYAGNNASGSVSFKIDTVAPDTIATSSGTIGDNSWYISDVTVTLSASDATSGVIYTMYKIDDGSWQTYNFSFVVSGDGAHTVYFYSVDYAGRIEATGNITFKIDKTAPTEILVLTIEGIINGYVEGTNCTVSWNTISDSPSGIAGYEVQVSAYTDFHVYESSSWALISTWTFESLSDDELYYYRVRAKDNASNVGSWSAVVNSTQDNLPPGTPGMNSEPQYTQGLSNTVSCSIVTDAGVGGVEYYFECAIDAGFGTVVFNSSWINTSSHTFSTLTDGQIYYYRVKARDAFLHETSYSGYVYSTQDNTPPVSTLASVSPYWHNADIGVAVSTAADNGSGVKEVALYYKYSADNSTFGAWIFFGMDTDYPYQWNFNFTAGEGYYRLCSIATDMVANIESYPSTYDAIVGYDTTLPVLDDTAPSGWQNTTVTVTLTPTDALSGVDVSYTGYKLWLVGSAEPATWTDGATMEIATDGRWYIKYHAVDNAGNENISAVKEVWVDKTKPVINITGVSDGMVYNTDVTPVIDVTDTNLNLTIITLNGVSFVSGTTITEDGSYTLYVYADDTAGNNAEKTVTFTIGKTLPNINITGVENGEYYNTDVTPIVNVTDDDLNYTIITLNNESFVSGTTITEEGTYTLYVYAEDLAGNNASVTLIFTVDKTLPVITITGVVDGVYYNVSVTPVIEITDTYPDTSTITLNDVIFTSGTEVSADGVYYLNVSATDLAGNSNESKIMFTIDKTAPSVTITDMSQLINTTLFTLHWTTTDTDINYYEVKLNDGSWINVELNTSYTFTDLLEGGNTLYVRATDNASNVGSPDSIIITVDTTKPTVVSTVPEDTVSNVTLSQSVIIVFNETMNSFITPTLIQIGGVNPGGWVFLGWSTTNMVNDTVTWGHNNWSEGDTVSIQVSGYQDLAGNAGDVYTWSFTTEVIVWTVDYVVITDTPNGTELGTVNLPVSGAVTAYASGYNNTVGYTGLVECVWSGSGGSWSSTPATTSTFTAGVTDGTYTQTASNATLGVSDTFDVDVLPPTVDYIVVTDVPDGSALVTVTLPVGGTVTAYASGYNTTSGYVGLVECAWSGSGGSWSPSTGTSSTFTAGTTADTYTQTAQNTTLGVSDTFDVVITIATVDYIRITDSPDGTEFTTVTLPVGETVTAYVSGYNTTSGYVGLVECIWTVNGGDFNNATGTSSTFTAGATGGTYTQTAQNATLGVSDTFDVEVLSPTVDYITVTDAPDGASLVTVTLSAGGTVTAYASGYNNTGPTYVGLVECDWTQNGDVTIDNATGTSTTYTAGTTAGIYTQTAQNISLDVSDSFDIQITTLTVDYIVITGSAGGSPLGTVSLPVGGTVTAYASGYNNTGSTYVGLVECAWSGSGGTWSPTPATSSTFTAGITEGTYTQTVQNVTLNISDTFDVVVLPPTVDYITITDSANGTVLVTVSLPVGGTVTAYASGYNDTAGYVGLVKCSWSGSWSPGTGNSSTFTAGNIAGTFTQTAQNVTLGVSDTFDVQVLEPTVDYILIVDSEGVGGSEIPDQTMPVGFSISGYASSYNITAGYLNTVSVTWSVENIGAYAYTTPDIGNSSIFYANITGGTATWKAEDDNGHNDNVVFTIMNPTVDYIQIRTAPGGGGSVVLTKTYNIGSSDIFYAARYNYTTGFIDDSPGTTTWVCNNTSVGTVTLSGSYTTFNAVAVGICFVTANDSGIINTTGVLTMLPWGVDYIIITDTPNGTAIIDQLVGVGFSITGYASGYNNTVGYIGTIMVTWTVENMGNATAGTTPTTGVTSIFNAGAIGGVAVWEANDGSGHNDTVTFTLNNPPIANFTCYQGIDAANNDYVNISIRVAGEKHKFVNLTVYADNNSAAFLSVERLPGKPQTNSTLLLIDSTKNYTIVIDYTAYKKGGNPVWINITYRNISYSTHLVFHETCSKMLEPSLSTTLDFIIRMVGLVRFDASMSYDPDGAPITQYSWDFGDGENGTGEIVYHSYAYGNYTINLTVKDEYNFTDTQIMSISVNDVTGLYAGLTKSKIITVFCPADMLITNKYNTTQWIGQENGQLMNWIPNATGIVYGDVEIYIIPQGNIYSYDLSGVGPGEYDFSIYDPGEYDPGEYDPGEYGPGEYGGKTYVFSSSVTTTTSDSFTLSPTGDSFTVTSNENKYYSMYIVNGTQSFVVTDMSIGSGSSQSYIVTDWDKLGSSTEAGVNLGVDDNNDGIPDFTQQLTSGSKGTDIIRTKTAIISGNNVTVKYTGPAALNIKASTGTVPDTLLGIGVFVEVTGAAKNIMITIHYTPEQLKDAGIKASDLSMYYWNETTNEWIKIEDSGVWENNNTVWANVEHLTIFAPMAEKTAAGKKIAPISSLSYIIIFAIAIVLISAGIGVKKMKKKGKNATVKCPKCKETFPIPSAERPLSIVCPKCGSKGTLK